MHGEPMMTVVQAAARLGANEQTIRRWLRTGKLRGHMPGGNKLGYRIPADAVERLLVGEPAPAPPTSAASALRRDAERLGLGRLAAGIASDGPTNVE